MTALKQYTSQDAHWRLFNIAAALTLVLSALSEAAAGSDTQHCDALLRQDTATPLGYRQRGDRCEGLFAQDVGNTLLFIASFTRGEGFKEFRENLIVSWDPVADHPVQLRAVSLRRGLHYRMDSLRPPGSSSFSWPLDVVSAIGIRARQIGALGWWETAVDGVQRPIHVPLEIEDTEPDERSSAYQITLVPGAELEEIYLTLAPLDASGQQAAPVFDSKPLGWGYYPASRALPIPLDMSDHEQGLYVLEVAATLRSGAGATTRLWFRHGPSIEIER